jgi:hypothetical protein
MSPSRMPGPSRSLGGKTQVMDIVSRRTRPRQGGCGGCIPATLRLCVGEAKNERQIVSIADKRRATRSPVSHCEGCRGIRLTGQRPQPSADFEAPFQRRAVTPAAYIP